MAWVVTAWKPEVLAAAERERVRAEQRQPPRPLPIPEKRAAAPAPEAAPGEITARKGRATMRDSPLGELFRTAG